MTDKEGASGLIVLRACRREGYSVLLVAAAERDSYKNRRLIDAALDSLDLPADAKLTAPPKPQPISYDGIGQPYRIALDPDWKVGVAGKDDRQFTRTPDLKLSIRLIAGLLDLEGFPDLLDAALTKQGLKVTRLEHERPQHDGKTGLHLLLKIEQNGTVWHEYLRLWTDKRTYQLHVRTDHDDPETRRQVKEALDAFTLPPPGE